MIFQVKWQQLAKHMTKHLFVVLSISFTLLMIIRWFSLSFDVVQTFEHIAINQIPLVYFVIFLFSAFFGISLSYLLKCAYVEIVGDEISGRNYWLLKRQFPLNDIVKAYPFSSNGMPVVVVDAGKKGEIFIPVHIENSELLFGILDKYT
ncbi:hypothetical protein [Pseudidiomarina marina]|uniref:Uncharacterized protein n=1 Tax=Pseudidiomarina marina TaxID=502366 RepID=A0A432YKB1_9GAMM|nr:hypothetical protein [Pseudidiomarina marina]RUO61417.1 hypothetical protein CWI76_03925 [Pseudidiomarina marina]